MNRIKRRTVIILVLVGLLIAGLLCYCIKFIVDGRKWVNFPANTNCFSDGILTSGEITDINGNTLASSYGGERTFNSSYSIRTALCHTVGDKTGNVGTSVLNNFADKLMGYNFISGLFSPYTNTPNRVQLTVDSDLCETALDALAGRNGCVLVSNYQTGEILCMVSTPGFDPENPPDVDDIDPEDGIYINRALSAVYPPGSIFKIVTLTAAVENDAKLFSKTFECEGSCDIGKDTINCMGYHGEQGIYEAFSNSCNCAFSQLSQQLGGDLLKSYADKLGLTESHSVNGIKTAAGSFTVAAKGSADLSWSGIGQYEDMVNPEAFLRVVNAIAGDGVGAEPSIIKSVTNANGLPGGIYFTTHTGRMFSEETADKLTDMMRNNVIEQYGQSRFGDLPVCAKSGTAEVGGDEEAHAWFVGFVDDKNHPYSFVVLVENAGLGSLSAGNVAATVLNAIN